MLISSISLKVFFKSTKSFTVSLLQFPADLVTFTEKILNGKLQFFGQRFHFSNSCIVGTNTTVLVSSFLFEKLFLWEENLRST